MIQSARRTDTAHGAFNTKDSDTGQHWVYIARCENHSGVNTFYLKTLKQGTRA